MDWSMPFLYGALFNYFLFGALWIGSGLVTGWLRWAGDPFMAACWILVLVATWPYWLWKIVRDVKNGIEHTDMGL